MSRLVPFRPDPPHRPAFTDPRDVRHTRRTLVDEYLTGIPLVGPGCVTTTDSGFEALIDWVEGRA